MPCDGSTRDVGAMPRRVLRGFNPRRFKELRNACGISAQDLGRVIDVAESTVFAWENGNRLPNVENLAKAMRVFEKPISDVVQIDINSCFPGDFRVLKGKTQPQLAKEVAISTARLRDIERGAGSLNIAIEEKLANTLGVSSAEYSAAYYRARNRPVGTPA